MIGPRRIGHVVAMAEAGSEAGGHLAKVIYRLTQRAAVRFLSSPVVEQARVLHAPLLAPQPVVIREQVRGTMHPRVGVE
jgi:hypothetical protein